jgi:hypothetical protein
VLPVSSFLLAIASCFLLAYHQPKRTIINEFGERYTHWIKGTSKGSLNENKKYRARQGQDTAR